MCSEPKHISPPAVSLDVDPAPGTRWFVAQTISRREIGAATQLEAQGYRVFLPQVLRTVRHARKMRTVKAAAFPGYIFVALDLQRDRWRSVNGTFGVASLIMGEELPMAVPKGLVEALLAYVDGSGICRFDRDLIEGQAIRVIGGPLAKTIGTLVRLDGNGRVRVLLEVMGSATYATMERAALEAA